MTDDLLRRLDAANLNSPQRILGSNIFSAAAARIRALEDRAEAAEAINKALHDAQPYRYIGRDGKSWLARELEDRAEAAEAKLEAANQRAEMLADSIAKAHAQGKAEGLREAAEACEAQMVHFLSPEYATHQPLSSHSERFACGVCAAAIRALIPADTPAAPTSAGDTDE